MSGPVGIVGAGRFGTGLAQAIAETDNPVLMYSRSPEVVESINEAHRNPRLPQLELARGVAATSSVAALADAASLIIVAVPSTEVTARLRSLGTVVGGQHFLVHAIGGVTPDGSFVSDVMVEETSALRTGVIAGPALANFLLTGQFSSLVVASAFEEVAALVAHKVSVPKRLRVRTSNDLRGVEVAAAASSVYALTLGIADETGLDNVARAVISVRAVEEGQRLVAALGGDPKTFVGQAGLGNLIVRSSGNSALDYVFGRQLVQGKKATPSEGARSARALAEMAQRHGLKLPLLAQTAAAVQEEIPAADAIAHIAAG